MNPSATAKCATGQIRDDLALGAKHGTHELAGFGDLATASAGTKHVSFHAFQASPVVAMAVAACWRRASSISRASVLRKWLAPT